MPLEDSHKKPRNGPETAAEPSHAVLERLAAYEEKAPDDFVKRVMAALPDPPPPRRLSRLMSFWPSGRFWPVPAMAGALVALVFIVAFRFVPVSETVASVPVVFDLYAPSAQKVTLAGAFSGWAREYPLTGPDRFGYWSVTMPLAPGRYEYGFQVNGAAFRPDDDGQPMRADGFGLKNSVVVVPKALTYHRSPDLLRGFYSTPVASSGSSKPSLPPEISGLKWRTIVEAGLSAGLEETILQNAVSQLKKARFSPQEARMILAPLFRDLARGQHAHYVLHKLAEGALKGFPARLIADVCLKRQQALEKAADLLNEAGIQKEGKNRALLREVTALAIENGWDMSLLLELLHMGQKLPPAYTAAIIRAGELLHAARLGKQSVTHILKESLQRRLTPKDMTRLTHHVVHQLKAGRDGPAITKGLWI